MQWKKEKLKRLEVFFEFLIFGIVIGVIEDLIAVKLATGYAITWVTVGIIVLVTIPFAAIGELIIDNIDFAGKLHRKLQDNGNKQNE